MGVKLNKFLLLKELLPEAEKLLNDLTGTDSSKVYLLD